MSDGAKIAAIWCRVSGPDQSELSPDTQESVVRQVLEARGFSVPPEYVIKVDWSSLDLMACPEFQRLRGWIANGEITALGVLNRDRLQAQGLQRLIFLAECRERHVEVLVAHGPPLLDGVEGQFLELGLAFGKETSVLRAQSGARDGLRARAALRGVPAVPKPFFGYRWNGTQFIPDDRYPVVQGIWRMLLEGKPDRRIAAILTKAGVPSPSGRPGWTSRAIFRIATNPAYAGLYTALRHEAALPKTRRGSTYGKSTTRSRPAGEHVVLPNLVVRPAVTHEEFDVVQARRAQNKLLGGRRSHEYLLRGMIFCEIDGNHYTGTTQRSQRTPYAYRCTGRNRELGRPRCQSRVLPGPALEQAVWAAVKGFLEQPELFLAEVEGYGASQQHTAEAIRDTMGRLEKQLAQYAFYRQRAYDEYVREMTDEETYRRVVAGYRAHEAWLKEEMERQGRELGEAERKALDAETVRGLYVTLRARLETAGDQDKRFVLECLGARIAVGSGAITVELAVPERIVETVRPSPRS
ncbi:MAG TPA: recombinase family protein [Dehalococcoidia bacterium]|nr:recombinase family protein [Dehalococcoidia bacterium]